LRLSGHSSQDTQLREFAASSDLAAAHVPCGIPSTLLRRIRRIPAPVRNNSGPPECTDAVPGFCGRTLSLLHSYANKTERRLPPPATRERVDPLCRLSRVSPLRLKSVPLPCRAS